MADLRYPIGEFELPGALSAEQREDAVRRIESTPARLRQLVLGLSDEQLNNPYRPGGWTVRQVVHHLPDSHVNSYCRLKLALTENVPSIQTYEESWWAQLPDSRGPIDMSLDLLDALHRRWVYLFLELAEQDWARTFRHPDLGEMRVDELAEFYAWHGDHHIAHIKNLIQSEGW